MTVSVVEPGTQLVRYEAARAALAEAHRVDEVKDIRDKALAIAAYAKQANDTAMVEWATEIKVRAERRAGELLRDMPNAKTGPRPELPTRAEGNYSPPLSELGITEKQSSRWQKLAAVSDERFEAAVEAAKETAREVTTTSVLKMAVHYSSATDQWATPQALFDLLDAEFGFETDVCADATNAKCHNFYSSEQNGLAQEWAGACWMNPPYGDEIAEWVAKAHASAPNATVVCLVPARVDTGWWWEHCRYGEIRFLRGRLKFGNADTGAPFPSAIVVFGPNVTPCVKWWESWPRA